MSSLLTEIRQRETRRGHLAAQLRVLEQAARTASVNPQHLREDVVERVTKWQALLQREPSEARQILRELLVGRFVFVPKIEGKTCTYEFTAETTLSGLVSQVISHQRLVTPAGFDRHCSVEFLEVVSAA